MPANRVINILQITDTHLYKGRDECLLGLNTDDSLEAVISEAAALRAPVDMIIATGDLVHDGSAEGYQRLAIKLGRFGVPVFCLPGNHDESETLKRNIGEDYLKFTSYTRSGDWQLIFLDSTISGSEGGHLNNEVLDSLNSQLEAEPDLYTLVCLHHQPVKIGCQWLDKMAVDNPEPFFSIIDRYPRVQGIVWGHVHQDFDQMRENVRLLASPSTCIQFQPGSREFAVEDIAPGYRWLKLYPDGKLETGINRLQQISGTVDLASTGY
jgi:Icc protein